MVGPKFTARSLLRIHERLVDAADMPLCRSIVEGLPAEVGLPEAVVVASQVLGTFLTTMSEPERAEVLAGLFMAIRQQIDKRS